MGAASRTRPRTADDRASASSSAASPSARMCEARSDSCRPASVNAIRRDVRLNNRVLSLASTRLTAFETVALERFSSAAAAAKERASATFAKIAKPSRSGSFDMANPETIDFDNFYFQVAALSIRVPVKQRHSPEDHDDRTQTIQSARRSRSWLAQGQAPLFVRRIRRPDPNRGVRAAGMDGCQDGP